MQTLDMEADVGACFSNSKNIIRKRIFEFIDNSDLMDLMAFYCLIVFLKIMSSWDDKIYVFLFFYST